MTIAVPLIPSCQFLAYNNPISETVIGSSGRTQRIASSLITFTLNGSGAPAGEILVGTGNHGICELTPNGFVVTGLAFEFDSTASATAVNGIHVQLHAAKGDRPAMIELVPVISTVLKFKAQFVVYGIHA